MGLILEGEKKIHLTSSVKWNFSNTETPLMRTSVNNIWNNVSEPKSGMIMLASAFLLCKLVALPLVYIMGVQLWVVRSCDHVMGNFVTL